MSLSNKLPWYKDGLKFECTQCGKCCTGSSGFIFVEDQEIGEMAAALNLDEKTFNIRYIRTREGRLALVEKKNEERGFDCIFLKNKKCQVYEARPQQCRGYPWWPENLHTEESWKLAARSCEGINDDASLIPYSEIDQAMKMNETN